MSKIDRWQTELNKELERLEVELAQARIEFIEADANHTGYQIGIGIRITKLNNQKDILLKLKKAWEGI